MDSLARVTRIMVAGMSESTEINVGKTAKSLPNAIAGYTQKFDYELSGHHALWPIQMLAFGLANGKPAGYRDKLILLSMERTKVRPCDEMLFLVRVYLAEGELVRD